MFIMPSITITCHPAAMYYALHDYVFGKRTDVWLDDHQVILVNDWKICAYCVRLVDRENPNAGHNFALQADDEEILIYLKLRLPTPGTNYVSESAPKNALTL